MDETSDSHLTEIIKSTKASLELLASDPGGGGEDEFREMIDDGKLKMSPFC